MVVKLCLALSIPASLFESSVISYGSKTLMKIIMKNIWFESSVISYGSKTCCKQFIAICWFESSVISYGSKTCK